MDGSPKVFINKRDCAGEALHGPLAGEGEGDLREGRVEGVCQSSVIIKIKTELRSVQLPKIGASMRLKYGENFKKRLMIVMLVIAVAIALGAYFVTRERGPSPTQLIVTASTPEVENFLEPLVLTATLTSNGNPVGGKTIEWDASPNIGLGLGSGITDSSGQVWASVPLILSSAKIDGPVVFTASFAGDNRYQAAVDNTIVVIHYP